MQFDANYDFVIVGAGSSGCVLANRLTADPGTRVLLLEAGSRDTNMWIHIPAGSTASNLVGPTGIAHLPPSVEILPLASDVTLDGAFRCGQNRKSRAWRQARLTWESMLADPGNEHQPTSSCRSQTRKWCDQVRG